MTVEPIIPTYSTSRKSDCWRRFFTITMSFSELENTNKASLKPDLGPIPRTKHPVRRRGICKCLCYAFTVFIGFITVVLGVLFIRGPWMDSLAPHKHLYQDLSNDTPHEIVHPLIDKDQKFDIVATVWIRDVKGTKTRDKNLVETVIFTDTIFSGIKMSDKNIRTSVNLDIPTDVLWVRFSITSLKSMSFDRFPARTKCWQITTWEVHSCLYQIHLPRWIMCWITRVGYRPQLQILLQGHTR